ncbi:hypothetical protein ALC53_11152 [Atta colombica]|uniref:Uncharacterized protein n=1 Tax=Atta colombica TaxID=520822 RepID=A0A195B2H9_9HYME|nr:hypothetical protein ALC53_11152 [Atta colombica]
MVVLELEAVYAQAAPHTKLLNKRFVGAHHWLGPLKEALVARLAADKAMFHSGSMIQSRCQNRKRMAEVDSVSSLVVIAAVALSVNSCHVERKGIPRRNMHNKRNERNKLQTSSSFRLESTANNGSLGIPHGCNCKNNGSYTVRASVRQRMCGFALPTWRICRSAIRIHLRFANERASHSYMQ